MFLVKKIRGSFVHQLKINKQVATISLLGRGREQELAGKGGQQPCCRL